MLPVWVLAVLPTMIASTLPLFLNSSSIPSREFSGEQITRVPFPTFFSHSGYDGVNPNNNPICGKNAQVTCT